jgi:ATP-dependent Lhr-like helicase
VVVPAPRGKRPTWGGYLPQFLGRELCQSILGIVTSEEEYPYHHASAAEALCTYREELGHKLQPHSGGLVFDDDGAVWWTFADGHINATLRHALRAIGCDWTIIPDNFSLRFRGEGVSPAAVMAAQRRIREPEVWQDEAIWSEITDSLPSYRLSKFQPLLPPWINREVIATYLLDVAAAQAWLHSV